MKREEIKRVRKAMGMSQKDFATAVGVSFATVNRWERGHNEPQADRVARISDLYAEHLSLVTTASSAATPKRTPPEQLDFEGSPEAIKLAVDSYRLRNGHIFNRAYGLELSRVVPLL
jgi:transcriptional regulator with XRE-family HTH domain